MATTVKWVNNNPPTGFKLPKKPTETPFPMGGNARHDYPGGSKVRVKLHDGETHEGIIYKNPILDGGVSVRLMHSKRLGVDTYELPGVQTFMNKEIHKITLIEEGKPAEKLRVEFQFKTFVVRTAVQLDSLIATLQVVKEVGVKFLGLNFGRFTRCHWVMLFTHETIIPIDIQTLQPLTNVWEKLKVGLFEHPGILKVFHNVCPDQDFMYHNMVATGIRLVNYFDTQVCSFYLLKKEEVEYEARVRANPDQYPARPISKTDIEPLSMVLKKYLTQFANEREIELMEQFEGLRLDLESPFAVEPMPNERTLKYMALSVKFLLSLKDALLKEFSRPYENCVDHLVKMMLSCNILEAQDILLYECPNRPRGSDLMKGFRDFVKESAGEAVSTPGNPDIKKKHRKAQVRTS